jgi:hypothetical protein
MPQRAAPVRGRGRHARASTAPRWMRVVCPCVDVEVLKHSPLTSHTSLALSSLLSARPRLLLARNDSHGRHQADRPPLLFPSASTSQRFSATTRAPATAAYFPGQPQPRREDLWPRMVNRHGRPPWPSSGRPAIPCLRPSSTRTNRAIMFLVPRRTSGAPRITSSAPVVDRRRSTGRQAACCRGQVVGVRLELRGAHQRMRVSPVLLARNRRGHCRRLHRRRSAAPSPLFGRT